MRHYSAKDAATLWKTAPMLANATTASSAMRMTPAHRATVDATAMQTMTATKRVC